MTAIKPLWRLKVFAPYSEDPTETSYLTPIAGAAHSDPFVVTTKQGIAGTMPYLKVGNGRSGAIDYVSKKTTTGSLKLSVFNPRVTPGGDNAVRWAAAFLGDALGRTRLKGCKFTLELSRDGTEASLAPFTAGRIKNHSMDQPLWFELDTKDFGDDLNRPLFTGAPHSSVTYAALGPLLPNGVVKPFGNSTLTPPLAATIGAAFATAPDTVVVNITSPATPAAMITQAVLDSNGSTALRLVELTKVSDGSKHYYQWPRGDAALASTNIPGGPTAHFGLTAFPIAMLPVGDARREALPAVGTAVTVSIVLDAPPTDATPILVDDVHPIQYLADQIDGKFSLAPGTTTLRPLGKRNTAAGGSWATLLADPSFGTMRDVVPKMEPKANDYIEKNILQRYNIALVRDETGGLDVVDMRRKPSLAGIVTITDDDLADDEEPAWSDSRDGAITALQIEYYVDQLVPATDLVASGDTFPTVSPALLKSTKSSVVVVNDLSTLKDVGEKVVTIASRGDRIATGDWTSAHFGRVRLDTLKASLLAAGLDFLRPIGSGVITAKATYRTASANAAQITPGLYCIVQHTKLPDPASNQHGGARLMLCLSADENSGRLSVQWMDAGTDAVAVIPNITGVTSADPYSIDVALTLNGLSEPADVYVAVTDTTVAVRPADNAAEWAYVDTMKASGTLHVGTLPTGKRIWTRAQSHGTAANAKLPSAWEYPPAPGYLDLAAGAPVDLTPPGGDWSPIPTGTNYGAPVAGVDPVGFNVDDVVLALLGTLGDGDPGPLEYHWRTDGGAWSAYGTAHPDQTITRAAKATKVFQLQVRQSDLQESAIISFPVTGKLIGIDDSSGQVDPTQPLSGTSHFIPRATDVNGMILDPGTQDSQARELRRAFAKANYTDGDTADYVPTGATYRVPRAGAQDGSGNLDLGGSAWINRHLGNVADGGGFTRIQAADVSNNRVSVVSVEDTRNTNANPSAYPKGVTNEFKDAGAIGIPGYSPGSGVFGNLRTEKPWNDNSGGNATQTFSNTGDARVWKRTAPAGGTSGWDPWRILTEATTQRFDRDTGHLTSDMQDSATREVRRAFAKASYTDGDDLGYVPDGASYKKVTGVNGSNQITPTSSVGRNRCKAFHGSLQTISDASASILAFDNESYDTGGLHSTVTNNSRITVPSGGNIGVWMIWAQVNWVGVSSGSAGMRRIRIIKNGVTELANIQVRACDVDAFGWGTAMNAVAVDDAPSVGDYYQVEVYQQSGGSRQVNSGSATTFSACHLW